MYGGPGYGGNDPGNESPPPEMTPRSQVIGPTDGLRSPQPRAIAAIASPKLQATSPAARTHNVQPHSAGAVSIKGATLRMPKYAGASPARPNG